MRLERDTGPSSSNSIRCDSGSVNTLRPIPVTEQRGRLQRAVTPSSHEGLVRDQESPPLHISVAQLAEQRSPKPKVVGSIPTRAAMIVLHPSSIGRATDFLSAKLGSIPGGCARSSNSKIMN